jgi:recombinational DNA repair protein (RecF pathway)
LSSSITAAAAAAVVAELLATFCLPGDPSELAYRLGSTVLDALLAGTSPETAVTYAQLWVLALSGLFPAVDRCAECRAELEIRFWVRHADGQPLCAKCATEQSKPFGREESAFLRACRHLPVKDVDVRVPEAVARWLDRLTQAEAELPLRALRYFRRYGE